MILLPDYLLPELCNSHGTLQKKLTTYELKMAIGIDSIGHILQDELIH